ncbi:hypothetical protein DFQ26_007402 [Actinomortierella ambigua]|nr:hypothetical protein DFQ26_007402 [Actinomortierella ambigua]
MSAPSQQQPTSLSQLHPVTNGTRISHSGNISRNSTKTIINANGSQAQTQSNMLNGILLPPTANKPIAASPPPQPIAPMDKSKPAQKAKDAAVASETDPKPKQVRKKRGFYKKTLLRMQAEAEAKARADEIARAEAGAMIVDGAGIAGESSTTSSIVAPPSAPVSSNLVPGIDSTVHPIDSGIAPSPNLQRQQHQQQQQQQQQQPHQPQQKQQQQQRQQPQQSMQSSASSSTQLPPCHDSLSAGAKPTQSLEGGGSGQQMNMQGASSTMAHKDIPGYSMVEQGSVSVFETEEPKSSSSLSKGKKREHRSVREWDDWIQVKEEQSSQPLDRPPAYEQLTPRMIEKLGVKSSRHQNRQQPQQKQQPQQQQQQNHPQAQPASQQRHQHFHAHQSQHQSQQHDQAVDRAHFSATPPLQSQFQPHFQLGKGLAQRRYQHADDDDDDDEDADDDVEESHDTRADLEKELAMLAQEAADERKRQEQMDERDLERAEKTAQAVALLRDLKSKLRGATELLGQNLQFQSGDMISQIFDEVLDDIGRDNLDMLNSLTDRRLKQQDDKYASILTSPEHADHIVTRSAVAAQLQGGERPTGHDLVSRRGRTKPHTVVRRLPDYNQSHNQQQQHLHKASQMNMEESDVGDLSDHEDEYSADQYIGQAWNVHADKEPPTAAALLNHTLFNSGTSRGGGTGPSKRNHYSSNNSGNGGSSSSSNSQHVDHSLVTRPKKALKTSSSSSLATFAPSTYSSPSETLRMLSIAEDELRRRQKADFEALQRKHYGEFQELQHWMQKQHEEFQNVEFAKTRHIREQLEQHPATLHDSRGRSNGGRAAGQRVPLARQLTFSNRLSSFDYDDEGEAGGHPRSPERSSSPPSLPSARLQKKLRRDSSGTAVATSHSKVTSSSSSSSMMNFDQDRLIRASQQQAGLLARTSSFSSSSSSPSSSSAPLKLTGVHHKLSKQMLKNRDGLPMSTMNLALTAMNEKRKLLKRASKLNMGTQQPVFPEGRQHQDDYYDDDSDESSGVLQNGGGGYRQSSPSITRLSTATAAAAASAAAATASSQRVNDVALQARATTPASKRSVATAAAAAAAAAAAGAAAEMLSADMSSPFLVHNGSGSRSGSMQPSHARSTSSAAYSVAQQQQQASSPPAPVSPSTTTTTTMAAPSSRKMSAGASKRRKSSSAGKPNPKHESVAHVPTLSSLPPTSSASLLSAATTAAAGTTTTNDNDDDAINNNFSQALLNHYSHQWKSDAAGAESLFDLMLSDPPEFDVDESEVESMLATSSAAAGLLHHHKGGGEDDYASDSNHTENGNSSHHHRHHQQHHSGGGGGDSRRGSNSKRNELNATPTSNAFKWYQKQQRLAEDLARQPKIAPLQLEGLTDDDSAGPTMTTTTHLATPFDFASLMGQAGNSNSNSNSNSSNTALTGSTNLFSGDHQHGHSHFNLSNGLGDMEHDGNGNGNGSHPAASDMIDPPSSASLLPLDYMPASSPISPSMEMLFSDDGHHVAGDWSFKGGDLTDEFLHPESPGAGGGGGRGSSHDFLEF